ncbi:cytidylate kinase family protein [Gemmatimonadota bacterium]
MPIVSICRGTKSGGDALAKCLAERLDHPTLGREVVQQAAVEMGVPPEDLGGMMEDPPGLFGRASILRKVYISAVQSALADAAAEGNLVYHGLAGGRLLSSLRGVLCVRLVAPLHMRVQALRDSHGMDESEAEKYIREVDDSRVRWVRTLYGEDLHDPTLYDLVLNLGTFSIPEACEIVLATALRPEFEINEDRLASLQDFRTGCRVRTALLEDIGTQSLDLEATALRGVVEVSGKAPLLPTSEVGNRITEIARSVPGVEEVRLKIEWFDPYP